MIRSFRQLLKRYGVWDTGWINLLKKGSKMKLFRNPEVRQSLLLYLFLTVLITGTGAFFSVYFSVGILIVCTVFILLHIFTAYIRYKKISCFSQEIDSILHGKVTINLSQYAEGELAILQNEVSKLTVQLKEQAENLIRDKSFLTDSIADISHQIRTPLTSVNLIVSFLSQPGLSDERRFKFVKEAETLLSRIDWLISALLKMSKLDSGTANMISETVDVKNLIKRAAASIAISTELREQQLVTHFEDDPSVTGDLKWTVEAVENILKNCMEHTPAGGIITVRASENGIYTEIVISDNGSGIDKEDLPYLFDRFYRGKNSGDQSIGIGLALARMIIVSQNGTVKAENGPAGGAVFTIRFYKSVV